jgi:hypothetical protein
MGRTVDTYRGALKALIAEWADYRKALRKEDREAFDELMKRAEQHASAAGYADREDPMEAFFMSVLLEQEKEIAELKRRLRDG